MANNSVEPYSYEWWTNELDKAEKRLKDNWWIKADKIVKKYKNKKDETGAAQYWINVFWANTGVLKASLYANPPRPMINRIWSDTNDPIARVAAMMLERCVGYDLMKNNCPMDAALRLAVEDWLVPGLGMIWLRYSSETETQSVQGTSITYDVVSNESVDTDYVHWRDLIFPSSRVASDVWFIARKIYLSTQDLKSKFKVSIGKDDDKEPSDNDNILPKDFKDGKVCVYEIWCKKTKKVYWYSREVKRLLQTKDDFLRLEGFYPCPMPLMATHTTDDYLPRPDYTMMKDQYDQLNELNTRITILERALRVVGVYDSKNAELKRLLSDARENDMIPVEKWAMLAEGGGLKGVVDWFPLDQIANVLDKLREQKAEKKQEIYELSGISDIMRGASNPRETLGAQKLKSQYGSIRLQARQDEIAQFVRTALFIKAEIICEHFQDKTIMELSNVMMTPDAQYAPQAIQLLRDFKMAQFRLDINEQSLALPDYQQEQQNRTEFLTTVGQFLSQAQPVLSTAPQAMPYMLQMIRWVTAGFKGSNEIQGVLDQAIAAAQQSASQPQQQQQPPDNSLQVEQVKQQGAQQQIAAKSQAAQQESQVNSMNKMRELKLAKDLELRNSLTALVAQQNGDAAQLADEQQHDMDMTSVDHSQNIDVLHHQAALDQGAQQQDQVHEAQMAGMEHQQGLEQAQVAHQNTLEQGEQSGNVQLEMSRLRGAQGNKPVNKHV